MSLINLQSAKAAILHIALFFVGCAATIFATPAIADGIVTVCRTTFNQSYTYINDDGVRGTTFGRETAQFIDVRVNDRESGDRTISGAYCRDAELERLPKLRALSFDVANEVNSDRDDSDVHDFIYDEYVAVITISRARNGGVGELYREHYGTGCSREAAIEEARNSCFGDGDVSRETRTQMCSNNNAAVFVDGDPSLRPCNIPPNENPTPPIVDTETTTTPSSGGGGGGGGAGVAIGALAAVGVVLYFLSHGEDDVVSFTPNYGYSITESGYSANAGGRMDFRKDNWHLYFSGDSDFHRNGNAKFRYQSGGSYTADFWTAEFSESVSGKTADYDLSLSSNFGGGIWKLSPVYRMHSRFADGEMEIQNFLNLGGEWRYEEWKLLPSAEVEWRQFGEFGDSASFRLDAVRKF